MVSRSIEVRRLAKAVRGRSLAVGLARRSGEGGSKGIGMLLKIRRALEQVRPLPRCVLCPYFPAVETLNRDAFITCTRSAMSVVFLPW